MITWKLQIEAIVQVLRVGETTPHDEFKLYDVSRGDMHRLSREESKLIVFVFPYKTTEKMTKKDNKHCLLDTHPPSPHSNGQLKN